MKPRISLTAKDEQDINMTPMLDIVFIMLIFFIVTTSFTRESGIEVQRPEASTAQELKGAKNILIAIEPDGAIWLDKRNIDFRSIAANIERLRLQYPDGRVIVQADKAVQTGDLVRVMDQIRSAGVRDISLATEAEREQRW